MDRHVTAQLVAMVVVLFALLRWVPSDDPKHPLGLGRPWQTLDFDMRISAANKKDRDMAVALLRFGTRPRSEPWAAYFANMLGQARALRRELREGAEDGAEASADVGDETSPGAWGAGGTPQVQFMGVFRNDLWWLTYVFYPVRCSTYTLEEGSRMGADEPIAGARLFSEGHTEEGYQKLLAAMARERADRKGSDDDDPREEGGH